MGIVAAGAPVEGMRVEVPLTLDGTPQPCLFFPAEISEPAPLLVLLHTWSGTYDTAPLEGVLSEVQGRKWHLIVPEFRGPNLRPEACASPQARQDVLDAVAWAREHHAVDAQRIYLAGLSGGGHMAMVMAAHAPELWAGVSAWAGISDLAQWHAETKARDLNYWQDVEQVAGGAPGASAGVDEQLRLRSPIYALRAAAHLPPLDIATGIHDGHTGSVPVHHSLDAFNAIAPKYGAAPIPAETMEALAREESGPETEPQDAILGRRIHLRRNAGPSRVTIFEGGHEWVPAAVIAWLAEQTRPEQARTPQETESPSEVP
jgi:poly(3-hydroxybutyrate) depolymerase